MIEVVIVCEGQTEAMFTTRVLQPSLAIREIFVEPRLIPTSPKGRGRSLKPERVLRYLRNTLRERSDTYITTFFDLYGLRNDFPGYAKAPSLGDPIQRAFAIEAEFHRVAIEEAQVRSDRFFPHIQPYEFESLLFSGLGRLSDVDARWKTHATKLEAVRRSVASPEYVNDHKDTHPSARLKTLPGYRKVLHGTRVTEHIGLDVIRSECHHFGRWLSYIESLRPL